MAPHASTDRLHPLIAGALCLVLASCDRESAVVSAAPAAAPPVADLAPALRAAVDEALAAIEAAPTDPAARLELALLSDAHGQDREAAAGYAQARELGSGDDELGVLEAAALWRCGEHGAAVARLASDLPEGASLAAARVLLGEWLLETGDPAGADTAFVAAGSAGGLPAGLGRARVALAGGDGATALERLEAFADTHAEVGEWRFLRGSALRLLGRLDAARTELAAWEGEPFPRERPWRARVEARATGTLASLDQALEWVAAGHTERALPALRTLHAADPEDSAVLEKYVAACLDLERLDEARTALGTSLSRRPDHHRSHYLLARVEEAGGRLGHALQAVTHSLTLNDGWAPAHELAARLRWRGGDLPGAAAHLELALELGGPRVSVLQKLARAQGLLGRHAAAAATLERALELQPDDLALGTAYVQALSGAGRFEEAWEVLFACSWSATGHPDVLAAQAALVGADPEGARERGLR